MARLQKGQLSKLSRVRPLLPPDSFTFSFSLSTPQVFCNTYYMSSTMHDLGTIMVHKTWYLPSQILICNKVDRKWTKHGMRRKHGKYFSKSWQMSHWDLNTNNYWLVLLQEFCCFSHIDHDMSWTSYNQGNRKRNNDTKIQLYCGLLPPLVWSHCDLDYAHSYG